MCADSQLLAMLTTSNEYIFLLSKSQKYYFDNKAIMEPAATNEDRGFGSATVIDQDGAHTHVGHDGYEDEQRGLEALVDGLHDLLVKRRGLSWSKPSNA